MEQKKAKKSSNNKEDLVAIALLTMSQEYYKKCDYYAKALVEHLSKKYKKSLSDDNEGYVWDWVIECHDIADFKESIESHKKNGKR